MTFNPTAGSQEQYTDTTTNAPLTVHELKTHPQWFALVKSGAKPFEIREDDRCFKVGDALMLREWDPATKEYTGEFCLRFVTSKVDGGQFGVAVGTCVLGLAMPTYPRCATVQSPVFSMAFAEREEAH